MRTKALILTAALGAMAAVPSMAQVYSQNAVGYYTLNLVEGFNLIAYQFVNQQDHNINTIIPPSAPLPNDSFLLKWDAVGQTFGPAQTFFQTFGWFEGENPSAVTLTPGEGAFLNVPAGSGGASVVVVGDVPQGGPGEELTLPLVANFQIISQLTPQAIGLDATGFPATNDDFILFWDPIAQSYGAAITYFEGFGWFLGETQVDPTAAIGEAMLYNRVNEPLGDTWRREFTVN